MMRAVTHVVTLLAMLAAPVIASAQEHQHHPPPPKEKPKEQPKEQAKEKQGPQPVPPLTDEDRKAAFPAGLEGHTVHDSKLHYFVLFDQLEWTGTASGGASLENTSWVGGDINRLWLRTEAESEDGELHEASVDALFGRSFSRWWDVVGGVRQDFRPGDPQTWLAVGIQGLAPQWFEVEATGYVGAGGRTAARLEVEYELLLTNRLILQPLVELEMFGKSDPERGIGAGLSSLETGLRLRYEIRRELAPYIGVTWDRKLFGTADAAERAGEDRTSARVALGLRAWF